MDAPLHMPVHSTDADLQKHVCAFNEIRLSVPEYSNLISPQHEAVELIYKTADRRRARKARPKICLQSTLWTVQLQIFKRAIHAAVKLTHSDSETDLLLLADAFDLYWSDVRTQIPNEDKDIPFKKQQ